MDYYKEPVLIDQTELDCEPHQALRNLYHFNVADGCDLDVIAKISIEDGVYVAHAYIDEYNEADISPEVADGCLSLAKSLISKQFKTLKQRGETI